ncbi:transmembrane protein [Cryptosporidium ryanae]|uniref:uncharacterized protein n=1 Tax=Cryptosporidium ryanae TaxID=515981 RepID=UPI00351A0536|nr:transmembrane protein [Cryptosporidium ryanae]
MQRKTNNSFVLCKAIHHIYYELISSLFYGKKFNSRSHRPKFDKLKLIFLLVRLLGWLIMTLSIPICGIILVYYVSPSRIDIVPAFFEADYLVISNPLNRINSQSENVLFSASFSFLFEVKYLNLLFIDRIIVEGVDIAYLGKTPNDSKSSLKCNSDNLDYLFQDFTEQEYHKVSMDMIHFSCTDNYSSCIVGITLNKFKLNNYNQDAYMHDLRGGYSNFVMRTSFSSSQLTSSLVSGRLGYRYTPFSIPIIE